jgi:regulator of cell morphogenesis and NO signaling
MQTSTEKTVREIALENPSSIRIFESLGIDYCCGGKRPLSEACLRANVGLHHVIELLEDAARTTPAREEDEWNGKTLGALIQHIVQNHHAYVRREIPRIQAMLTKVVAKHGPNHPEVSRIQELFLAIGQELSTHLLKEEQILFPYIEQMETSTLAGEPVPPACFDTVKRPIANMIAEHDDAGALLAQIRSLATGYAVPEGVCPTFLATYRGLEDFERDLHRHIHLENNILFPRAVAIEAML